MIVLTVALPMYRTKHIGWIALESLARQACIDFEWELIVAEEENNDLVFGKDRLKEYYGRLRDVNCKRMLYIDLKDWIPLSQKWRVIAHNASDTSRCFLLQAADCYSNPNRLRMTHELFQKEADWVQSKTHVLYDLASNSTKLYDVTSSGHPCGADMACRTDLMKKLPNEDVKKCVDGWIYKNVKSINNNQLKVLYDESDNWQYSVNINGINNISDRRSIFNSDPSSQYFKTNNIDIKYRLPLDVYLKLMKCKEHAGSMSLV